MKALWILFLIAILPFDNLSQKRASPDQAIDTSKSLNLSTSKLSSDSLKEVKSNIKDSLIQLKNILNNPSEVSELKTSKRSILFKMGNLQRALGEYSNAVDNYEKSLALSVNSNDKLLEAHVLNSLGGLYYEIGEYDQGIEYCKDALLIYENNFPEKKSDICLLYANIGNFKIVKQDYTQAVDYLNKALALNKEIDNEYYNSLILSGLGYANLYLENVEASEEYFKKGIESAVIAKNTASEVANLASLGDLWIQRNNLTKAEYYIYQANRKLNDVGEIHVKKEVLESLVKLHKAKKEYKKAFEYQEVFVNMKDSIFSMSLKNKLAQASLNIDNIKKEKAILELKVENERKVFQLRRTRYIILFSSILFIMILIVLFFFIQRNRYKNKIKLNVLENKMIRLQLKPHFIFNVLSSIQNFMTKNDSMKASAYLSKFARLIRNVLNASRTSFTPLSHEIKMLGYYLELQQLRFDNSFDFSFKLGNVKNPDYIFIPPLIVQPLIENAVEHGLKNIDYQGVLTVSFELLNDQQLKVVIEDNGVGLNSEGTNNQELKSVKKSVSLKIIKQQIELFNSRKEGGEYNIFFANGNNKKGTKVELIIPFNNKTDEN